MCGIIAIFVEDEGSIDSDSLVRASNAMRHRGPDDEGYFISDRNGGFEIFGGADSVDYSDMDLDYLPDKNEPFMKNGQRVLLGHRRLSIIDLTTSGHQPMSYGNGRYWIVYNGEIYNYIEVREELTKLGHHFHSRSDTEVILAAYDQWGPRCVERFNGMWAFVLVDLKDRKAFISRDRFGVKPLYYWRSERGFLSFSSEIKAFTKLPGWNPVLDCQRAYDFLIWNLSDHTEHTLFKDVCQLRAGHNLFLNIDDPSEIRTERYYEVHDLDADHQSDAASKKFRSLLEESVKLRMRSDVVVGSCLSGGLDSSSITALADAIVKENDPSRSIHTFTSCSVRKEFDETRFSDALVESCKLVSFKTTPDAAGLISDLERLIWHQDEPFMSTSIFASWCVFRTAKENGIKVVLDGQGADEYLAGYDGFIYPMFMGLIKKKDIGGILRELICLLRNRSVSLTGLMSNALKKTLSSNEELSNLIDIEGCHIDPAYPVPSSVVRTNGIKQFSKGQLMTTSLPRLLHWEDRNSMAWSVESRVPFLDYRLVEYTVNLPDEQKIMDGTRKVVLRNAMRDALPRSIVERKDKMGFVTPERYWLTEGEHAQMLMMVEKAFGSAKGFIKPEAEDIIKGMVIGAREYEPWAWRFIIFGLWMGVYDVKVKGAPQAKQDH